MNQENITLGEIDQGSLILHANRELKRIIADTDPRMNRDLTELKFQRAQVRAQIELLVNQRDRAALALDACIRELEQLNFQLAASGVKRTAKKKTRHVPLEMRMI